MRILLRDRHEILELLEGLNEEGLTALRQSCCECVGFKIGLGRFVTCGISCQLALTCHAMSDIS